jgi:cell division protease FtsH
MDTQLAHMYQRNSNRPGQAGLQRLNDASNGDGHNGNHPHKKWSSPLRAFLLLIGIVSILAAWYLLLNGQASKMHVQPVGELAYSSFYQQVQAGNVTNATFQGQDITGNLREAISLTGANGDTMLTKQYHLTQLPGGDPNLIALLNKFHVRYQAKPVTDNTTLLNIVFSFLPLIFIFGVIFFLARRATKGQQTVFSFGKSRARVVLEDKPSTTFADVAGVDEAKRDLVEVVEFLKTPQKLVYLPALLCDFRVRNC